MCTGRKELNVQHRDFVPTVVLLVGVRFRHREVGFEKKKWAGNGTGAPLAFPFRALY